MTAWRDSLVQARGRLAPGVGDGLRWWRRSLLAWLPVRWQWAMGWSRSRLLLSQPWRPAACCAATPLRRCSRWSNCRGRPRRLTSRRCWTHACAGCRGTGCCPPLVSCVARCGCPPRPRPACATWSDSRSTGRRRSKPARSTTTYANSIRCPMASCRSNWWSSRARRWNSGPSRRARGRSSSPGWMPTTATGSRSASTCCRLPSAASPTIRCAAGTCCWAAPRWCCWRWRATSCWTTARPPPTACANRSTAPHTMRAAWPRNASSCRIWWTVRPSWRASVVRMPAPWSCGTN
jgi:hypothetical protein